jgi:isopenicillin N synthase-like dioxygenase
MARPANNGPAIYADRFDAYVTPRPEVLVKVIPYPATEHAQDQQRVGEHRDTGLVTFVLQDEDRGRRGRPTVDPP